MFCAAPDIVNEAPGSISKLTEVRPVLVDWFWIAPDQTVLPVPRKLRVRELVLFLPLASVA